MNMLTRREWLRRMGSGFGTLGLATVLADSGTRVQAEPTTLNPLAPRQPHFPARAKRVIFLFMNGGPSHVDTFDPKPSLAKYHGQPPAVLNTINTMRQGNRTLMQSPFAFQRCGQSGIEVSEIFPEVGKCIDDICVLRS